MHAMDIVLFLARLILASIFALAAIGKFLDLKGSRAAIAGFGFPEWFARPAGLLLPVFELMTAISLLALATTWWGALGAFSLLTVFAVIIAVNMALGKRPDCHCFGQLHSEPIGLPTLARNLSLALLAGLVILRAHHRPGLSLSSALNLFIESQGRVFSLVCVTLVVLLFQTWLMLNLFRQNGRLLLRIEQLEAKAGIVLGPFQSQAGLKVGTLAPEFELQLASGGTQSLANLRSQRIPVLLLFTDPKCGPCTALLPEIAKWSREYRAKLSIALVSRGELAINQQYVKEHGLTVLVQEDREITEQYKAYGTPSAVMVNPDGKIAAGLASGAQQITQLVSLATGTAIPSLIPAAQPAPRPQALSIGTPAPSFTLPDLRGNQVRLDDFRGRSTLLLFWNPACGFCSRMLPRLKEWERERNGSSPQLIVLSTGSTPQNNGIGLTSPVLLDQEQTPMRLFGAAGTPSGLLIDGEGKVASDVAVGADAIFKLVGYEMPVRPVQSVSKGIEIRQAEGD